MDKTYLTRKQLAQKLDKNPRTIKRWEEDGLPVIRVNAMTVLYDFEAVSDWLKSKEEK